MAIDFEQSKNLGYPSLYTDSALFVKRGGLQLWTKAVFRITYLFISSHPIPSGDDSS